MGNHQKPVSKIPSPLAFASHSGYGQRRLEGGKDALKQLAVHARGLTKTYRQGPQNIEVLHGIDLDIQAGEIIAVTGPSGAGKSTLLHLLGLMDRPTAGTLALFGKDASALSEEERARCRNRHIGFLFQFHYLMPEFSARENVMLPLLIRGAPWHEAARAADQILCAVRMEGASDRTPATLSGGEQQRVALARALVHGPALILADEPTGNLDRANGQRLLDLLCENARAHRSAIVLVTHDESIAPRVNRVLHLADGRFA